MWFVSGWKIKINWCQLKGSSSEQEEFILLFILVLNIWVLNSGINSWSPGHEILILIIGFCQWDKWSWSYRSIWDWKRRLAFVWYSVFTLYISWFSPRGFGPGISTLTNPIWRSRLLELLGGIVSERCDLSRGRDFAWNSPVFCDHLPQLFYLLNWSR